MKRETFVLEYSGFHIWEFRLHRYKDSDRGKTPSDISHPISFWYQPVSPGDTLSALWILLI